MDYANFGPTAIWPVTSTIASVAGVLLIFGQQFGRGAKALAGLALDDLGRLMAWIAHPWVACVVLLAAPLAMPHSDLVATLRGAPRLDNEIDRARADGYYEELNRSTADRSPRTLADRPVGWKAFAESGLVVELTDYRRRALRPDLDTVWNGQSFRTDRLGHRGPRLPVKKAPGTLRIVLLGSSNSLGHGVDDDATYARRLETWLSTRAGQGSRVEVVNLSVSGDSPTQRWRRLQLEVPGLEPDWILSDITALDFSLEEQHLRWVVAQGPEIPFPCVADTLERSNASIDDPAERFHKKLSPLLKPLLGKTFEGCANESKRIKVPFTILILPRADSKEQSQSLFQLFRDLADRQGLPYLDLSDAFDRFELDDYRIAPWDHHPNNLGHQLIFERLRDLLIVNDELLKRVFH